jgi:hypothetical protein
VHFLKCHFLDILLSELKNKWMPYCLTIHCQSRPKLIRQINRSNISLSLQTLLRIVEDVLTLKFTRANSFRFSSLQSTEHKCSATSSDSIESSPFFHRKTVHPTASRNSELWSFHPRHPQSPFKLIFDFWLWRFSISNLLNWHSSFSILNESMQIKHGKVQQAFVRKFAHERVPSVLFVNDRELKKQTCLATPTANAPLNPWSENQCTFRKWKNEFGVP